MSKAERYETPELPPESVLDLSEYLDMQRVIGDKTRYRVLATLLSEGELSASDLGEAIDVPSNRLHYHLDRLAEVGLVANRKRRNRGQDGLYSYYVATPLGRGMMTHGIGELIAEERELLERYG